MKKALEKFTKNFVTNVYLIALVMLNDIYKIIADLFKNHSITIDIDYFDIIIKLLMATALMFVFRKYYEMKKLHQDIKRFQTLSKLFNQIMFEEQYKLDKIGGIDRNHIIEKTKSALLERATNQFEHELKLPKIKQMVNDYFDYQKVNLPLL